jgi:hypothetical protein
MDRDWIVIVSSDGWDRADSPNGASIRDAAEIILTRGSNVMAASSKGAQPTMLSALEEQSLLLAHASAYSCHLANGW